MDLSRIFALNSDMREREFDAGFYPLTGDAAGPLLLYLTLSQSSGI